MFCVITDTWTGGAAAGRALGPAETDGPSIIPVATDSATRTEPTSRDARTPSSTAQVTEQWNSRRGSYWSANASGGGQEQTRWRSPYAWSTRATGGQYLSGFGPVGNAATSRG